MSNLIKCKHCQNEIAKTALVCPKCGGKNKRTSLLVKILLVFFLFGAISSILRTKPNHTTAVEIPRASTAPEKKFEHLFFSRYDTNGPKGISQVMGFFTDESKVDSLKKHCKNKYQGFTACYYYKSKPEIVHISSLKPLDAMSAAENTKYFVRVDISVDGNHVDVAKKK